MFFRFQIPGFGNFVITAGSRGEAARILQNHLRTEFGREAIAQRAGEVARGLDQGESISREQADRQRQFTNDLFLTAPPPGTTGATTQAGGAQPVDTPGELTGAVPSGVLDPEAVSPFGTFREVLRDQVDPDSLFGNIAAQRFRPLSNTFAIAQALEDPTLTGESIEDIQTAAPPGQFQQFLRSRGLTGGARTARSALQGIAGRRSDDDDSFLALLRQASPGSQIGQAIRSTAGEALRTRLSPISASLFADPALDLASRRFESELAQGAAGGSAPTFAASLLRQLGLA